MEQLQRNDTNKINQMKKHQEYRKQVFYNTITSSEATAERERESGNGIVWNSHAARWWWLFQTWKFWWFTCLEYVLMYLPDGTNVNGGEVVGIGDWKL